MYCFSPPPAHSKDTTATQLRELTISHMLRIMESAAEELKLGDVVRIVKSPSIWYLKGAKAVVVNQPDSEEVNVYIDADGFSKDQTFSFLIDELAPWNNSPALSRCYRWAHWNKQETICLWEDSTVTFCRNSDDEQYTITCDPHGHWRKTEDKLQITFDQEAWISNSVQHTFVPLGDPKCDCWQLHHLWGWGSGFSKPTAYSWCVLSPISAPLANDLPEQVDHGVEAPTAAQASSSSSGLSTGQTSLTWGMFTR